MNKIISRTYSQRKRMFKSMIVSLCANKRVVTYTPRAKEMARTFDKLIARTKAQIQKSNIVLANRVLREYLGSIEQTSKAFKVISSLSDREGGFLSVRKFDICQSNSGERSIVKFSDDK